MKVTPLDLRQAQFRSKLRGFDPDEVTPFLTDAAYELEQALKDIDRLRQEAARNETILEEFRERENALRNTLLTAQRLADQIKENAEVEAKTILREAESRADLLLQKAQGRLTELDRDINEMRLRRRDVEGSLESAIASLTYALDFMRGQDQAERDEKLLLHRPKAMDILTAAGPQGAVASGPQAVVTGPQPVPSLRPAEPRLVAQNSDARPQVAEKAG
jgi:cell division initiation protein